MTTGAFVEPCGGCGAKLKDERCIGCMHETEDWQGKADQAKTTVSDRVPYIDYLPDNSDEALASAPSMARRCADCAYTEGTSANLNEITKRIADDCARSRCAFWCHKSTSDIKSHLCAGWVESLTAKLSQEAGNG